MNTRHYGLIHSILGLVALSGCVAAPETAPEEKTANTSSALILPPDVNWTSGMSPDDVVLGHDSDGTPFYACRSAFANSIAPGKIRAGWTNCDFGYGGLEEEVSAYQTLIPQWTSATYGQIPPNAVAYGVEAGHPLYVCRALTSSFQWQTGKVGNGIPGCDYPYGGKEITAPSYEVLANTTEFDIGATWIAQGAALPYNALRAGTDSNGAAIYPCIAPYNGDLHPGKTEPGWGTCDISYGGTEIWVPSSYEILTPSFTSPPLTLGVQPYMAGTDTNGSVLGICNASYGGVLQVGKYLSSGVCDFASGGKEIPLTSNYQILALHEDTTPIVENFNITFPSGVALGGSASLTLRDDGSYVFSGSLHDSGAVGYSDSTLVVVRSSSGVAFTFARNGSAAGTDTCLGSGSDGCRDDSWTITGTNPSIAAHWEDLKKGTVAEQDSDASVNFADLWSQAKAGLGDIQQIVAVVGPIVAAL